MAITSGKPMQTYSKAERKGGLSDLFSLPILGCIFSVIISPLLLFYTSTQVSVAGSMEVRYENKVFWPLMVLAAAALALRNYSRGAKLFLPLHVICLLAYLAFAGLSVLWAFAPDQSSVRYLQQLMVVISIILPSILTVRPFDLMHGMFLCFAFAAILNCFYLMQGYQTIADGIAIGYSGYFLGKNYLGECAAITLLLSLYEIAYGGYRRVAGIAIAILSIILIYFANSKTSLALAILSPIVAGLMLVVRRTTRASPAIVIWSIMLAYEVFSNMVGFTMARLSYMLYGDSTFTGRQIIWDFASSEIARYPLAGWGYQSFWLVGPTGPSVVDAPGWVKSMPNAHNGYYDTTLEMGYIGLVLLAIFLTATLAAIARVMDKEPSRGWSILSLSLYIMIHNCLESTWMRGFEFMWVVFLIIVADVALSLQSYRRVGIPMKPQLRPAVNSRRRVQHL